MTNKRVAVLPRSLSQQLLDVLAANKMGLSYAQVHAALDL
jgi:hypothetical protein